jgi:hypothetical protein
MTAPTKARQAIVDKLNTGIKNVFRIAEIDASDAIADCILMRPEGMR